MGLPLALCVMFMLKRERKEFAADILKNFMSQVCWCTLQQYLHVLANMNSSDLNASIAVYFRFCAVLLFSYVC